MKEVKIKSKIVGRGGASATTSPGKGVSVDMSDYLLKQIWEKVFEFRLTDDGTEYLFAKMNVAAQGGFTSFVNGGKINLPGLYDGIPFDNRTIWMNPETGVVEVLVSGGEGGGGTADFSHVQSSGTGNAFTSFNVSADGSRLTLVKGETFALQSDVEDLSDMLSEKADLASTLAGYGITNAYTKTQVDDLLEGKADLASTLAGYGITNAYTKTEVDDLLSEIGSPEELPNPYALTWSGYSSGSYDGSSAKSITIPSNTNQLTNGAGFITGISKSDVTDALGFTPYSAANPNGYVTSSGSVAYATSAGSAEDADYATTSGACSGNAATATTLKTSRTIWGQSFNGSGNVSGDMSSVGHITPNAHNGRSIGAYDNSFLKVHANYLTSGASANNLLLVGGSSASYGILFALNANGGNSGHKMAMGSNRLYPYTDGGMSLGSTYYGWEAIYLNTGDDAYGDADIYFNSGGTTYARIGSNDSGNLGLYARTSVLIRGGATGSNAPITGVTIDSSGNLLATGGITSYSDQRKKTILERVELTLKEIADAPLIKHYYNSDEKKTVHVGSIAQYWAGLNDWFCKEDGEGFLTMEIQNAALAGAISIARELSRYESKTDKQIRELKEEVEELKRKRYGNI